MGFFSPNFEREGTGIDKEEDIEYNFISFFKLFIDKFWLLIKLNLLFILFSVPIVTIPASLGALNSITMLLVQRKHVFLWSDFVSKFKDNWKQSTICFILLGILSLFSLFCLNLYFNISQVNQMFIVLFFITLSILFFLVMISLYVYPIITTISLPIKHILKNSIFLSIVCIKNSILGLIVFTFFTISSIIFLPFSMPVILLIGFSIPSFINSFITFPCVQKYIAIS
ncbi:MAG: DUF624 domain-containing protein [Clostridium sp.]|nr:DUF624 domain-containing protein [Clostridium sp.]